MTAPSDRELLETRARALARPPMVPASDTIEILTFTLSGETYGIESRFVFEVMRLTDLSRLPGAEPSVFGITTWRGALLTVCDLRPMLGLEVKALDDLTRLIVLGKESAAFAILANRVQDIIAVPADALRVPREGVAIRQEYLRGVTADAVIVLSADRLLAQDN